MNAENAPNIVGNPTVQPQEFEAPMAEPLPMPSEPSPAERLAHDATHAPPAPWCEHCAAGWGRGFPHYVKNESRREFP
eukprot:13720784-Alexandrium_andersonii.AAC.1